MPEGTAGAAEKFVIPFVLPPVGANVGAFGLLAHIAQSGPELLQSNAHVPLQPKSQSRELHCPTIMGSPASAEQSIEIGFLPKPRGQIVQGQRLFGRVGSECMAVVSH